MSSSVAERSTGIVSDCPAGALGGTACGGRLVGPVPGCASGTTTGSRSVAGHPTETAPIKSPTISSCSRRIAALTQFREIVRSFAISFISQAPIGFQKPVGIHESKGSESCTNRAPGHGPLPVARQPHAAIELVQ